jgi:hypothetical protein
VCDKETLWYKEVIACAGLQSQRKIDKQMMMMVMIIIIIIIPCISSWLAQ